MLARFGAVDFDVWWHASAVIKMSTPFANKMGGFLPYCSCYSINVYHDDTCNRTFLWTSF